MVNESPKMMALLPNGTWGAEMVSEAAAFTPKNGVPSSSMTLIWRGRLSGKATW